jgi:hypothetical protein
MDFLMNKAAIAGMNTNEQLPNIMQCPTYLRKNPWRPLGIELPRNSSRYRTQMVPRLERINQPHPRGLSKMLSFETK